ncbi:uncharacterized protein K489DRAFT_399297 [Dissoconium aciculare CBS 342.82]|uniref:Uncharacterized protein n=1 Tax=Dissoconium aciculare CBS 342.82 TaxID=1314786 RepID=A0A6J3MDW8_9PEZI|nr:uncharacterized protein K489DRAFT_399297 [Dissoconium aciculare CBS 342.82]KAF1825047.1 hypothetical protein K489DRAFT_399297 [Dissoconium aciculare CBS 342.82]
MTEGGVGYVGLCVCGLGGGAESGTSCVYTSSHRSRTKRQFLCLEAKISLGGLVGWLQNPSPNPISKLVVITHQSRDAAAVYCSSVMERAQPRRKRPLLAPTLPLCEWAPADHEMMTDCRRSGRLRDQVQRKCWKEGCICIAGFTAKMLEECCTPNSIPHEQTARPPGASQVVPTIINTCTHALCVVKPHMHHRVKPIIPMLTALDE